MMIDWEVMKNDVNNIENFTQISLFKICLSLTHLMYHLMYHHEKIEDKIMWHKNIEYNPKIYLLFIMHNFRYSNNNFQNIIL